MKHLTEKQAWLTCAEDFAKPRSEGKYGFSFTGIFLGYKRHKYICWAIRSLGREGLITGKLTGEMIKLIMETHLQWRKSRFCSGSPPANDLLRADFCYMQYYMLEYPNPLPGGSAGHRPES